MTTKRTLSAALGAALLLLAPAAARAQEQGDDLQSILALMRADLNAYKVATVNEVMRLSDAEAESFWPIYRRYDLELAGLGDRRVALIREFTSAHAAGTLSDEQAKDLSSRFLELQGGRLDLWRKYSRQIERALSARRAAQFLQIEHQLALFVDINIAAEMPVIGVSEGASSP